MLSDTVFLKWQSAYSGMVNADHFEIQISEDSDMQWLLYGSRDGFISKYRHSNLPFQLSPPKVSYVPVAIKKAFNNGSFKKVTGWDNYELHAAEIEPFFSSVILGMQNEGLTFGESFNLYASKGNDELNAAIAAAFKPQGDIMQMHLDEYMRVALPNVNLRELKSKPGTNNLWKFAAPIKFSKGKTYYWRVRYRNVYNMVSSWNNTSSFTY